MGVNSLPKTVTRQRRYCDLNPGPSAPESSTLTTRLPSHPCYYCPFIDTTRIVRGAGSMNRYGVRLSVRLSVPSIGRCSSRRRVCCCSPVGRRYRSTAAGALSSNGAAARRSAEKNSKCGQCYVDSRGTMLITGYIHKNNVHVAYCFRPNQKQK